MVADPAVEQPSSSGPGERPSPGPRIWLMHPIPGDRLDLSDALRHGTLTYVDPDGGYLYADEVDLQLPPRRLRQAMHEAAMSFDCTRDHLVMVGDHMQLVLFTATLLDVCDSFKALRFDRHMHGYFAIRVGSSY